MKALVERANRLEAEGVFLGGPGELFETAGRTMLIALLSEGLTPSSKVLDIGCGCLRGGYWLLHFLRRGCYFGIEPNVRMLRAGVRVLLEPGVAEQKRPRFDHNSAFDFGIFEEKFDFFLARSIWTHASKQEIQTMLDGFVDTANSNAVFLASYLKPTLFKKDYGGKGWVGKSHESDTPGLVRHSYGWIRAECVRRGLVAEKVKNKAYDFGTQSWIRIKRPR